NNTAQLGSGGGIFCAGGTVTGCSFKNNSADGAFGQGGGIFSFYTLKIGGSTFTGNSASFEGGAIFNDAEATVAGSIFTDNTAVFAGGGIFNAGSAMVAQCSLAGNVAGSDGGAIFNDTSGTLTVKDSTVLGNTAPLGGDLYN